MTSRFDQRRQSVYGPQINVGGSARQINVGGSDAIGDRASLVAELERLRAELAGAARRGELDQELATDAEYQVAKAMNQARQPEPDRGRFLDHLGQAEALLRSATGAAGLVTALGQVVEVARQLMP